MAALPTVVYDVAHLLLTAVVAEYAQAVATPGLVLPADRTFPPPIRYVYNGNLPVAQCDSLVVAFDNLYAGGAGQPASPRPVDHAIQRAASFSVWVFRCVAVPQGEGDILTFLPNLPSLDDDAMTIMTDAFIVFNGIIKAHFDGTFRDYCSKTGIGPATPIANQGGIGGIRVAVSTEMT